MPVSAMVQATTTSLTFVPLFAMDHLILRQTKSLSSSFVDLSYYGTHRTANGRRGHCSATRTHGGGQLRTVPTIRKSTLLVGTLTTAGRCQSAHRKNWSQPSNGGIRIPRRSPSWFELDCNLAKGTGRRPGPGRTDCQAIGHSAVDGQSDQRMVQVLGSERGRHARSAMGTNALPLDLAVEIEAIVRVRG